MDSRYPPEDGHNVFHGVKNGLALYAYIAAVAFALGWVMGWLS